MQPAPQSDRAIKIGLLAVIVLMSWPVWIAFIAAKPYFDWSVAAGGMIPLIADPAGGDGGLRPTQEDGAAVPPLACTRWASTYTAASTGTPAIQPSPNTSAMRWICSSVITKDGDTCSE